MSNYLAIASVTEVLRQLLHSAIQRDVPGVAVNARRPGAIGGQPGTEVTIYLYRVSPNAALRNADDQLKSRLGSAVIVLGSAAGEDKVALIAGVTSDLTARVKAGEIVNHVAKQVGGKGGGRADLAQAGGTQPAKLPAALDSLADWLLPQLS